MSTLNIFTIGVYGSTFESFFNKLTDNNIDTFCDIRKRRGVRGSEYTYANSKRLQDHLKKLEIHYIHLPGLSPSDDLRKIQYQIDKEAKTTQRQRQTLSEAFSELYEKEVLNKFAFNNLIEQFKLLKSKNVVLFCVEQNPSACHRSLTAEKFHNEYGTPVKHL